MQFVVSPTGLEPVARFQILKSKILKSEMRIPILSIYISLQSLLNFTSKHLQILIVFMLCENNIIYIIMLFLYNIFYDL
ncbi:MAG: hypothetical protein CVT92_10665 [Bacteroidetes bacterium HGW-Bacteroidetes-1]|nr:MAG: hypothetical protein CVT92_10665 [Bacteroidetes bacterium HGW-Bacteroidetes-1]